jgi:hypothetical protein
MLGSRLSGMDADVVEIIDRASRDGRSPVVLAGELAPLDPVRTEAIVHAWPDDPREHLVAEGWAAPILERWEILAARMAGLAPLTWTREKTKDVARSAVALHGTR